MTQTPNGSVEPLRIIPLGGLHEIGKNTCVFEYGNELMLVDAGLSFPSDDMHGVNVVMPDTTYLRENEPRIRGMIVTHGHEDQLCRPFLAVVGNRQIKQGRNRVRNGFHPPLAHCIRKPGNLGGALALDPLGDQESTGLRFGGRTAENTVQGIAGFRPGEIPAQGGTASKGLHMRNESGRIARGNDLIRRWRCMQKGGDRHVQDPAIRVQLPDACTEATECSPATATVKVKGSRSSIPGWDTETSAEPNTSASHSRTKAATACTFVSVKA